MKGSLLLSRYLFREVGIATVFAFGVLCMILFYANAVRNDEYFLQALFQSPESFLVLSCLLLPYAVAYALPLGFVVGLLLSLGRMAADREILAMRTVGLGMGAVVTPVLILALIFSVLGVFFGSEWGPRSRAVFEERKAKIVLNSLDLLLERDGVLVFELPSNDESVVTDSSYDGIHSLLGADASKCMLTAGKVDGEVWSDLRIAFRGADEHLVAVLLARSAEVRSNPERGVLSLHLSGIDLEGDFNSSVAGKTRGGSFVSFESWSEPLELPIKDASPRTSIKRLGFGELLELHQNAVNPVQRLQAGMLLHKNLALGCSPLCLALVALPLALRVGRRETMLNASIALGLAMLYFFLLTFLPETLHDFSNFRPSLWVWFPNLLSVCGGAWLTFKLNIGFQ